MLNNHFTASFRTLRKNKGFSALNIIGLATGLATCLLIVLYISDELSFDRYNLQAGRIYRINHEVKFGGNYFDLAQTPAAMGPETVRQFPQVEQYTRIAVHEPVLIRMGNENLRELRVAFADSTLFAVFTLPMIAGDPGAALKEPHSIVITESMARKYFGGAGGEGCLGRTLLINNKTPYKITGIIKDIPVQSHFVYDFFLPMCENADSGNEVDGWLSENYNTYLLFKKGVDAEKMIPAFDKLLDEHVAPILKSVMHVSMEEFRGQGSFVRNTLTPLTAIHLQSNKMGELGVNGSLTYVYLFAAIALVILLIACVNFMNLSTARSANRAKEVGVRKVLGSTRKELMLQFLTESFIVALFSLLLALAMAVLLLHWFNGLSGKQFRPGLLFQPAMLFFLFALWLSTGLLAGIYPAFFLSAFRPIEVLKNKLAGGFKNSWLRNSLVVFQFAVSIILITSTLVIYTQLQFIRNTDIGFKREQVLIIQNTGVLSAQAVSFKNELLNIRGVDNVTMTGYLPVNGDRSSDAFFTSPSMDAKTSVVMQKWKVDEKYIPTLGISLVDGRNFSSDLATDSTAVIVNEAAARLLGRGVVGKSLYRIVDMETKRVMKHTIVGVVKNFNFNSLRDMITPLALRFGKDNNSIAVHIRSADLTGILSQIRNKWQNMATGDPFVYSFMDEAFDNLYRSEQQTGKLFTTFSTLAILIACLGLFGLATYAAEQRFREIGIRKVLGASVGNIVGMLSADFLRLVLLAAVIAFPIAGYLMHKWLQNFAYRIPIGWWIFLVSGLIALLIAFVTVIFRAMQAAMANPVKSLRTE
jgi:putative ABC transport system permease protein